MRVDASQRTFLGLCDCGARRLALSHQRALEMLADHEARAHPGVTLAREALAAYTRRHAKRGTDTPKRRR